MFERRHELIYLSGGPCERGEEVGEEARVGAHPGEDKGAAQGQCLDFYAKCREYLGTFK